MLEKYSHKVILQMRFYDGEGVMKKRKCRHSEIARTDILCIKDDYSFVCPHASGIVDKTNRRISHIEFCRNGNCDDYEPVSN